MEEKLLSIKNNAISLILETKTPLELEEIRIQFLGRNGEVTQLLKNVTKLPKEEKPKLGSLINQTKNIIEDEIRTRTASLKATKTRNVPFLDVTEPGIKPPLGHLHLVTQAITEITEIFTQIGFSRSRWTLN